jgi:carbon monoxide dehydrogenase subunit G
MGMAHIKGSIAIRRPVEEVFDFVADERNEPAYNPQMRKVEKATPGPIGIGTVWRATTGTKRRLTSFDLEITDFVRPRQLGSVATIGAVDIRGGLTFRPTDEGTRMDWSWDCRPKGLLKLAGPVITVVGRRQEQRTWTGLKRHLEQAAGG